MNKNEFSNQRKKINSRIIYQIKKKMKSLILIFAFLCFIQTMNCNHDEFYDYIKKFGKLERYMNMTNETYIPKLMQEVPVCAVYQQEFDMPFETEISVFKGNMTNPQELFDFILQYSLPSITVYQS